MFVLTTEHFMLMHNLAASLVNLATFGQDIFEWSRSIAKYGNHTLDYLRGIFLSAMVGQSLQTRASATLQFNTTELLSQTGTPQLARAPTAYV